MNIFYNLQSKSKYIFVFLKTFLLFCRFLWVDITLQVEIWRNVIMNLPTVHHLSSPSHRDFYVYPHYLILFMKDYIQEKKSENDVDNK